MNIQALKTIDELRVFCKEANKKTFYFITNSYPFKVVPVVKPRAVAIQFTDSGCIAWAHGEDDFHYCNLYDDADEAEKACKEKRVQWLVKELEEETKKAK